ncbi:hypothetical protein N7466_001922 [Penicillium verhagenii]|uniref:uncharacterized protein n=1 Tax=Penicillium verhagenii TaxID=1562060 RepID=UPI002545561F|nr:uncharacterized protein N7466_001922 [Penicillium verhagenii]KAJ5938788.1 hypothetical protein N7466_001922 [Penicillium verhagenii]
MTLQEAINAARAALSAVITLVTPVTNRPEPIISIKEEKKKDLLVRFEALQIGAHWPRFRLGTLAFMQISGVQKEVA